MSELFLDYPLRISYQKNNIIVWLCCRYHVHWEGAYVKSGGLIDALCFIHEVQGWSS